MQGSDVESDDNEEIDEDDDNKKTLKSDVDGLPEDLRMDEYDDETDMGQIATMDAYGEMEEDDDELEILDNGSLKLARMNEDEFLDEDDEDEDDLIEPSDNLLVVAMTEDDYSHLEVQILTEEGNMYVHHDIALPDFPLCLAWLDCPPFAGDSGEQKSVGNYIAVGTFGPAIEIWNLDVIDPLEPTAVLGGIDEEAQIREKKKLAKSKKSKTKNKEKNGSKFISDSHTDSVLGLSWNTVYRQALASASADKAVKIWDITTQKCSFTFNHHSDKVQAVKWNPAEAWLLATGSFDKTIGVVDCRSSTVSKSFSMTSDVEALAWDPYNPYHLYCTAEDGTVSCFDIRQSKDEKKCLYSFQAHGKTASCLSFSDRVPGMLATSSIDKTVRVWDVKDHVTEGAPPLIAYKSMNVGKLFTLQYYQDDPFMMASAGDKGMVAVWESDELAAITDHFQNRVKPVKINYNSLESDEIIDNKVVNTNNKDDETLRADIIEELGGVKNNSDAKKKKIKKKKK